MLPLALLLPAAIKGTSGLFALFAAKKTSEYLIKRVIPYGDNCNDGSHDHRRNRGNDRTPRQKEGDKKRKKD